MKNLRNKNQPPNADLVQVYLQSSWDIVVKVYEHLLDIENVADAIDAGELEDFLSEDDINTLAKLNAIITDATLGDFASQAEAEAGVSNVKTMTPLRVAQAIAALAGTVQNQYNGVGAPTVNDDASQGYVVGSVWIDVATIPKEAYRCVDPTAGAAVWLLTTLTSDELALVALTGDSDDLIEGVAKLLMTAGERAKLLGIEANATADMSAAEIKVAYESNPDTNAYNNAEKASNAASIKDTDFSSEGLMRAINGIGSYGSIKTNLNAAVDPTVNDDSGDGYSVYSPWVNTTLDKVFFCLDATIGAAVWQDIPTTALLDADFSAAEGMMRKTGPGAYEAIKSNLTAVVAPTVNEDSGDGYAVGSVWVDTALDKIYFCIDATVGAAVWQEVGAGGGGMTVTPVKTANYNANVNEVIPVDSSAGAFTVTFPAGPLAQERIIVVDVGKACAIFPVTLARNGKKFDGVAANFVIDQDHGRVDASYDGVDDWNLHLIGTPEVINASDLVYRYVGVNDQVGTTYQLVLADAGKLITMSNAAANTLTIPANASVAFEIGTRIDVLQKGAGQTTIAITSDTLNRALGLKINAQWEMISLVKIASTTWVMIGGVA